MNTCLDPFHSIPKNAVGVHQIDFLTHKWIMTWNWKLFSYGSGGEGPFIWKKHSEKMTAFHKFDFSFCYIPANSQHLISDTSVDPAYVQKGWQLRWTLRFIRKHSEVFLTKAFLHVQSSSLILKMWFRAGSSSLSEGRYLDSQLSTSQEKLGQT